MNRRRESAVRERQRWRKKRGAAPRYAPNYKYMREFEEAIILSDIEWLNAMGVEWVSAADLRRKTPGRYSVKLLPVLQRMARARGTLEVQQGRSFGRICPTFRKRTNTMRRAA